MLGKMLRIDVGAPSATPYAIPADNPFFSGSQCELSGRRPRASGNCPEIYAWGFRNPWRWSFDRGNGELWVADVGQGDVGRGRPWSRVGGNYGWRCREGAHDFNTAPPAAPAAG